MSPEYHPQTQSGFVLSLSSEPSASAQVVAEVGAGVTFSTAFSTTEVLASSSSAAPTVDVQARFLQPIRSLMGEMTIRMLRPLDRKRMLMAHSCLESFRKLVIDTLGVVETAEDLEMAVDVFASQEAAMQRIGFELVGYPEILQRLRDWYSSWAEAEVQASPQRPFADIKATEDFLGQTRRQLVRVNELRSLAQVTYDAAFEQAAKISSEREAVRAQIAELQALLERYDGQLAGFEGTKATAQKALEDNSLEASLLESQAAALSSSLAGLRESMVPPSQSSLQTVADFRDAASALQASFCDLFDSLIPKLDRPSA